MTTTRIATWLITALVLLILWPGAAVLAESLRISRIQYVNLSSDPTGTSPYDEQTVDCLGGIVTHIISGSYTRLVLQDPDYLDGWGAIQVKEQENDLNPFAAINVGDFVSLTNVVVEDYRGTTFLQYGGSFAPGAAFAVESTGNAVPDPKVVTLDQIAAPVGQAVADHAAELYESMRLTVEDVTVTNWDLGKAGDNYNLHNDDGDSWASDYLNDDTEGAAYHPSVKIGSQFISVTGILEQYKKSSSGWDYYQLLTTSTGDLNLVPEPTTWVALLSGMVCLAGWGFVQRRKS